MRRNMYIYINMQRNVWFEASGYFYQQIVQIRKPFGYHPEPHAVGMLSHETRKNKFCLCVDNFGITYFLNEDAHHLLNALKSFFQNI